LKILVASTNQGKLNELRAMLDADVQWVGLSDFEGMAEIEEDGATFAEKLSLRTPVQSGSVQKQVLA